MTALDVHIDYSAGAPPEYCCCKCAANGVKLWRQYQTFLDHNDLMCIDCTEAEQDGCKFEGKGHAIGWRVAAVPTEDGSTFWGYTSVPQPGVEWWDRLPLRDAGEV